MEVFLVVTIGLVVAGLGIVAHAAVSLRRDIARLRADAAAVTSHARPADPDRADQGSMAHR